jgi:ceramide glucosyltransferase
VLVTVILAAFVLISSALLIWQFVAALRFPLHKADANESFFPDITLLKPLKGFDEQTKECLRGWLVQKYFGRVRILFGVADEDDPVCYVVRDLLKEFPHADAELVITGEPLGPNAKVSTLIHLHKRCLATDTKAAKEMESSSSSRASRDIQLLVISDADVRVPQDFLANAVAPLRDSEVGLVNCFYRLANPTTLAMKWEAVAVNADFWSQVLQSNTIKPQDFALGAVMITRRETLEQIGGFEPLLDYLADDYQLGRRVAATGARIALSTVVVECWSSPMSWAAVRKHQLRWARTIRVCQPVAYFFSILSNATFWPLLWLALKPSTISLVIALVCWSLRIVAALDLQSRLLRAGSTNRSAPVAIAPWWLVPMKDLLQTVIWLLAFAGNRIEWRGERMRLLRDGTLARANQVN